MVASDPKYENVKKLKVQIRFALIIPKLNFPVIRI